MSFNAYRSTNYRYVYFSKNKPIFKGRYFCAYCGKLVKIKNITIDHLYPVDSVKKSLTNRLKLKIKGLNDINDIRNLVPACRPCNQKKGNKTGAWIYKGRIGRHQELWLIRKCIKYATLIALLVIILNSEIRGILFNYVATRSNNAFYSISYNNIINQTLSIISK